MLRREQVHTYCIKQLQKYLWALSFTRRSRQEITTKSRRFLNSVPEARSAGDQNTNASLLAAAQAYFDKENIQRFLLKCKGKSKTRSGYARALYHSMQSLGMQIGSTYFGLEKNQIQSAGSQCTTKPCDCHDWEALRDFCENAGDLSVRDRLFSLLLIHVVIESPEVPLSTVLNALARTTIDQINEGNLQNPIGDEPLVHNLLLLDQVPLQVQSIPNECAQLLQSYITGKVGLEPWKAMDVDEALPVCTEARFLFPDYSRFTRDGFCHLRTRKARCLLRRLICSAGLTMCEGLSTTKKAPKKV